MKKDMALEAELDVNGTKLTNHSVSNTLVKRLKAKKCNHRCDRPHRRAFTDRLRKRRGSRTATDLIRHQLSCRPTGSKFSSSLPPIPTCQTIVHHYHGCQVTINYGAGVVCFFVFVFVFFFNKAIENWKKLILALS